MEMRDGSLHPAAWMSVSTCPDWCFKQLVKLLMNGWEDVRSLDATNPSSCSQTRDEPIPVSQNNTTCTRTVTAGEFDKPIFSI